MRIGIRFSRKGGTRFISHLDMQRTFARALRRSGLPVKKSEGFNPHLVTSFAAALPVGMETEGDYIEFTTVTDVDVKTLVPLFEDCLPMEIRPLKIGMIPEGTKRLMASVAEAEVAYIPLSERDSVMLRSALDEVLSKDEYFIEKKGKKGYKKVLKTVDMRPLIHDALLAPNEVRVRLALTNDAALNPFVLLKELEKISGETIRVKVIRKDLLAEGGVSLSDFLEQ